MTMKENQNPTSYDALAFGSKEVFEAKVSDENSKGVDYISMDNEIGTIDSKRKDNQHELSELTGTQEKETLDSLSLDKRDKDEKSVTAEELLTGVQEKETLDSLSFETHDKEENSVTAEELKTISNGNECVVSNSSPFDEASDLFETVTNVFTDKNVLECELPELEVMKDIGVDNGTLEIKEEKDVKSIDQERIIASSVGSSEKDITEHCDLPELDQAATKSSEENSLVDKNHPVQEAGPLVLLSSFPDSSNEEKELMAPTDQIEGGNNCDSLIQTFPIENAVSVDPASSSPEARELEDNVQAGSLLFNRNVESGSITFDFLDTGHNSSAANLHEQPDESSPNINIQCVSSEKQQVDVNSNDLSLDAHTLSPSDRSQGSANDDAPVGGPKWQHDHGETSFSAITYSDPVALSRSLSHRSDASTTSTRSFAFPVLQSEWNSSPVRMAKADRRHFRKQKGWRSGLLCCRF